jgi:hypothetical protein
LLRGSDSGARQEARTATFNCPGVDPRIVELLNQTFRNQLKGKQEQVDQITRDANEWKDKYLSVSERLANAGLKSTLKLKAEDLLKASRLDDAGRVLDQVIAEEETTTLDELAQDHFDRAIMYALQYKNI